MASSAESVDNRPPITLKINRYEPYAMWSTLRSVAAHSGLLTHCCRRAMRTHPTVVPDLCHKTDRPREYFARHRRGVSGWPTDSSCGRAVTAANPGLRSVHPGLLNC